MLLYARSSARYFASRDAMNIGNVLREKLRALYDHLGLADVSDLYYLDYDKIEELPGFGEKKVEPARRD